MCLGQAEAFKEPIDNSHRVLILLSFEFIKDDWSLFSLQQVKLIIFCAH